MTTSTATRPEITPATVGQYAILTARHATYVGTAGHVDLSGRVLTINVRGRFGMVVAAHVHDLVSLDVVQGSDAKLAALDAALAAREEGGTFGTRRDAVVFMRTATRTPGA